MGEKNDTHSIFGAFQNVGNVKSVTSKRDLTNPGVLYASSVQACVCSMKNDGRIECPKEYEKKLSFP